MKASSNGIALGLLLLVLACKRDEPARVEASAKPSATVAPIPIDVAPLGVLGRPRALSADRAELVVVPKTEIVAEDVGPEGASRGFVLGALRTTNEQQDVPGGKDTKRVVIHHRIEPGIAYVRPDTDGRRRAWLDEHLAWGVKETQREVDIMLFRDAAAGGPPGTPPGELRVEGRVVFWPKAVELAPLLASVKTFVCQDRVPCDLTKTTVLLVD